MNSKIITRIRAYTLAERYLYTSNKKAARFAYYVDYGDSSHWIFWISRQNSLTQKIITDELREDD